MYKTLIQYYYNGGDFDAFIVHFEELIQGCIEAGHPFSDEAKVTHLFNSITCDGTREYFAEYIHFHQMAKSDYTKVVTSIKAAAANTKMSREVSRPVERAHQAVKSKKANVVTPTKSNKSPHKMTCEHCGKPYHT
jgi:predicted transcriptional regulator